MGFRSRHWKGQFWGKGRDILLGAVQKQLNRSIYCLGCGLGGPKEAQVQSYSPGGANVTLPVGQSDSTAKLEQVTTVQVLMTMKSPNRALPLAMGSVSNHPVASHLIITDRLVPWLLGCPPKQRPKRSNRLWHGVCLIYLRLVCKGQRTTVALMWDTQWQAQSCPHLIIEPRATRCYWQSKGPVAAVKTS